MILDMHKGSFGKQAIAESTADFLQHALFSANIISAALAPHRPIVENAISSIMYTIDI